MSTSSFLKLLRRRMSSIQSSSVTSTDSLPSRLFSVLKHSYYLGFTSFGGPPVHFQIFHALYVDKLQWIDESVYQELFAICQALPGPGSTKMFYCINLIHHGVLPAIFAFLIWSLPGALGMYAFAVGVNRIDRVLPVPVYALLSGLNAATVGIIALAAVQLSQKAITDKWTRILVFLGATMGMLYNALWYFPVLIIAAAFATVMHDMRWVHGPMKRAWIRLDPRRRRPDAPIEQGAILEVQAPIELQPVPAHDKPVDNTSSPICHPTTASTSVTDPTLPRLRSTTNTAQLAPHHPTTSSPPSTTPTILPTPTQNLRITLRTGLLLTLLFLLTLLTLLILRSTLHPSPLPLRLFANIYLAGTIIFGGGPVVIPLLREYTVIPQFVTARDFLLGLAIIQAFPGPNFNFAVYLGALSLLSTSTSTSTSASVAAASSAAASSASAITPDHRARLAPALAGAAIGYVAIFLPGLALAHATMGLWVRVRRWATVRMALRGMNAVAVGLIFTAVYRLFEIGWVRPDQPGGASLGGDAWWVVVVAASYTGGMWFGVSAPVAILGGALAGVLWWRVTGT